VGVTDLILETESRPLTMTASLHLVSASHTLRCDARQAERRFHEFEKYISSVEHFCLGDCLPEAILKGTQPKYIESLEPEGIPVINTLAIQRLGIRVQECRYITDEDYDAVDDERRPKRGDILLTMDGGPSIGKPVMFELDQDFAIDSHVAILRPDGVDPTYLVYLLASPFGQVQFRRAESGASGQTAVTEDDIRRFCFPTLPTDVVARLVDSLERERSAIEEFARDLNEREQKAWAAFGEGIAENALGAREGS
jgi:hypothetical protein